MSSVPFLYLIEEFNEDLWAPLNALAQVGYGVNPTLDDLNGLLVRHFDETIDGDPTNPEDLASFFDPFFHTQKLQSQ